MRFTKEIFMFTTAALLFASACKPDAAPPSNVESAPASQATPSQHAPANVVAGSYEDWCGEHHVPESLCTRCNPSLIAAFKASGDWCAEHDLPESQCQICNPNRKIERPPQRTQSKAP